MISCSGKCSSANSFQASSRCKVAGLLWWRLACDAPHNSLLQINPSQLTATNQPLTTRCYKSIPHNSLLQINPSQLAATNQPLTTHFYKSTPHNSLLQINPSQLAASNQPLTTRCFKSTPHNSLLQINPSQLLRISLSQHNRKANRITLQE
jgi:hypothetical protein